MVTTGPRRCSLLPKKLCRPDFTSGTRPIVFRDSSFRGLISPSVNYPRWRGNPVISGTNQKALSARIPSHRTRKAKELNRATRAPLDIFSTPQPLTDFDQIKDGFLHRLLHLHLRRRQGRRARQGRPPHRPVRNPLTSLPLHGNARGGPSGTEGAPAATGTAPVAARRDAFGSRTTRCVRRPGHLAPGPVAPTRRRRPPARRASGDIAWRS